LEGFPKGKPERKNLKLWSIGGQQTLGEYWKGRGCEREAGEKTGVEKDFLWVGVRWVSPEDGPESKGRNLC